MGRRRGALWLALASLLGVIGGGAWLVALVRADGADRASIDLGPNRGVMIEYEAGAARALSRADRVAIADVAARAVADVQRALPATPPAIALRVGIAPPSAVIPETGENGENAPPNVVVWHVDATRPEGVVGVARTQLRATLFHEIHHLVRYAAVIDHDVQGAAVREGLATAFERDFAGAAPAWGSYAGIDVEAWTREVLALPPDAPREAWLFRHPDGRRWIAMRVGTYLVDRAMRASGKSSAELVQVPSHAIVAMAIGDGG